MKDFLKFTLATIVGMLLTSVVLFVIGIGTLFGILYSSEAEVAVKKNSVMLLNLDGALQERANNNPVKQILYDNTHYYGLDDILSSIKKAKENSDIKGIYLQTGNFVAPYASLEEIRNALADFKSSGKFLVAYSDNYFQGTYYLASVADRVMINPKGMLEWKGIASQSVFYKELLDKLGVEVQIFRVGTYKSAIEPFTSTEMSPANREQTAAYIGSVWNRVLADVSLSRNVPVDSLNAYADRGILYENGEALLRCGLVDTLIYKNEVRDYLKEQIGLKQEDKLTLLDLNDMVNVRKNVPKDKSGNILALYYAYGGIDMGDSKTDGSGINSGKVIRDLRKLKEDKNVKAVVLRVNSPGGSAFGSEQIWEAVEALKKEKPVIVSMGDYAASGGYYISCGADWIVADPTTLTGSIGIFGMIPNTGKLMDKIGLDFGVIKTNEFSDLVSLVRPMDTREKALVQRMIDEGYELFTSRCAEGRNMEIEELKKIAEGRIWTGEMALELGLVDELGGVDRAIEVAVERAGLENYSLVSYPTKKDFWELLLESTSSPGLLHHKWMRNRMPGLYKAIHYLEHLDQLDHVQALMPFELNIQ